MADRFEARAEDVADHERAIQRDIDRTLGQERECLRAAGCLRDDGGGEFLLRIPQQLAQAFASQLFVIHQQDAQRLIEGLAHVFRRPGARAPRCES